MSLRHAFRVAVTAAVLLTPLSAFAQVFGTFTWQMEPYCNRITLTLTNTTAGFTLDGADDQCGMSKGSAYGVAVFTPGGPVALNFTIVPAPSGKAIHVSAVVNPGTGSGTWTDSAGRSGAFTMFGAGGGAPRPDPVATVAPASVTATELADGAVTAAKVDSAQVQLRVGGTCPAGQFIAGVNANGTVVCSSAAGIAAGSITATELADGAVTSPKVNSAQVQLRVSGTCPSGQRMTGVNADGTVVCAASAAANLQCVNTSVSTFTIAANSANFFNNPSCPAGYSAVTPYCWTAASGVYSQGSGFNANVFSNATFCSWQNTTGSSQTTFGGNVCCRVPAS